MMNATPAIADLSTATPAEIDTRLFALYLETMSVQRDIGYAEKALARGALPYIMERNQADLDRALARLDAIREEQRDLDNEFSDRGGWSRYFLVTNGNGHIHREMDCRTCYPTTQYAWLTTLSDCDEEAMVEEHGDMACTICFPDAPAYPAFQRSLEERKALEAAKAARECEGSRQYAPAVKSYSRYGACAVCGEVVSRTTNGNARTHKPKSVRLAEEKAIADAKQAKADAAAAKRTTREATGKKTAGEKRGEALKAISNAFFGNPDHPLNVESNYAAALPLAREALALGKTDRWQRAVKNLIRLLEAGDSHSAVTQAIIYVSHAL